MTETVSFLAIILFSFGFLKLILLLHNFTCWYEDYEVFVFAMLLGLALINIYFLSYASYMTRNSVLSRKLTMEEEKNAMYYEYYKTIEKNYSDCKKVLHDVRNHMQILEALYQTGTVNAAESYASTLANVIEEIYPNNYSDNKMLNIILYDKEKKAGEANIKMIYEVEEVDIGFLCDYDLATILCNLFDNAIHECRKLPEQQRKIYFKLRKVNEFIILCMENQVAGTFVKEKERKVYLRNIAFGTGLNNVKRVVEKHNGNCSIEMKEGTFQVSIYFCN